MAQIENLCELIKHDRELAGLTQAQLAEKLNEVEGRPIDPYTKKPKLALRTWLAKLEAGLLKRELSLNVRQWLAKTLNGNISLYQSLPNNPNKPQKEAFVFGNLDVLPLVKHLAKSSWDKITFDDLYRLCEIYKRCLEIGISPFDPFGVDERHSVKN